MNGSDVVILRRFEALKRAIESRKWDDVEFHYDNTLSAVERMLGTRDRDAGPTQTRDGVNEGNEVFHLIRWTWDVTRGWEIAGQRDPVAVPVDALARLLGLIRIDEDHIDNVDTSRPLLAVPYPDEPSSLLVIDGWHRIARAVRDGLATLAVVPLTETESKEIMK